MRKKGKELSETVNFVYDFPVKVITPCRQLSVLYRTNSFGYSGHRTNLAPQSMQWAIRSRDNVSRSSSGRFCRHSRPVNGTIGCY